MMPRSLSVALFAFGGLLLAYAVVGLAVDGPTLGAVPVVVLGLWVVLGARGNLRRCPQARERTAWSSASTAVCWAFFAMFLAFACGIAIWVLTGRSWAQSMLILAGLGLALVAVCAIVLITVRGITSFFRSAGVEGQGAA